MFVSTLGALILAQSSAVNADAPPVYEEPTVRSNKCRCPEETETPYVILEGLVVDAEITLAPDGRSANERQATIFNVSHSSTGDVEGQTKVWHSRIPRQCGVSFDYGKKYTVPARRTEDGELETDQCLMRTLRADK